MEEGRLELEEHNTCWCCGGVGFVLCPRGPRLSRCMRSRTSFLSISVFAQKVGIVQVVAANSSAFSREDTYLLALAFRLSECFSRDGREELH